MTPEEFLGGLGNAKLLAIIRGSEAQAAVRTAVALVEEGFTHLEVSLNTVEAAGVITAIQAEVGAAAFIGAGTVLTRDDVARVAAAGAQFIVTPALAPSVAEAVRLDLPVLAGSFTPTEVYSAMDQGAAAIKLFPASLGGPRYLSALRDPFPDVPFVPVGGVDQGAAVDYLSRGALGVGVGSPLIGDAASGGDLAALRSRARQFLSAAGLQQ
ncbi:2-dehydro-3-deoxyphosphogluconate aldolase/(4S)-4-hydroxy-2-oxoglutarate aldolase [Arthrobacter sp. CAN_A214]|uniref:bifunctional 4-hydroxy-2-oxoglutarate aldolase/2-dehydro-3-deoxy-phosphogluconate aldolase n=1 Tax=Arthrobacter sp. CAN_A214 TaxID=2787720 RepID=UPI0018CB26B3